MTYSYMSSYNIKYAPFVIISETGRYINTILTHLKYVILWSLRQKINFHTRKVKLILYIFV
jgi:hypothetical protein